MRYKYLFIILFFYSFFASGQEPSADFNLPIEVCLEEKFRLENTSTNSVNYEWDFCDFDLLQASTNYSKVLNFGYTSSLSFKIFHENGNYYGFGLGRNNDNLYRFDFGGSITNTPTIVNLGNPSSLFDGPVGVSFLKENGNWYALVVNLDNNNIIRLTFDDALNNNIQSAENLGNYSQIQAPDGITIKQTTDGVFAFITNQSRVSKIDFGNSILNAGTAISFNIPSNSRLWGIDIIEEGGNWYSLISSFNDHKVYKGTFGNSLINTPVFDQIDISSLALNSPADLKFAREGSKYFAFVQFRGGAVARFNFEETLVNAPILENLGSNSIIPNNNNAAFELVEENGSWFGFTVSFSLAELFRYKFEKECNTVSSNFSSNTNPVNSYSEEGNYPITLTAYHPNGNSASITKEITVTNNQAPDITFSIGDNLCITNPITFNSTSEANITSYNWDFGDSNTASTANPSHTYASAGTYAVKLNVTDANGCNNLFIDSVSVFEEPVADFQASAQGSVCSQKPIIFENLANLPTEAIFSWDFGDGNISSDENPEHVYAEAGEYTVTQSINMAGCTVQRSKTISVNPGPLVSFQTANNCLGEILQFENTSEGEFLNSYQWDFGDGTQTTQVNPSHRYDTAGVYNVQLTAFTTNGCDFTISQEVEIQPLAQVGFEAAVACATQSTQFTQLVNIADANITDYFWDFGVAGTQSDVSTEANPAFVYPTAGTYTVNLQVTTSDGCTSVGSQLIEVNAVPQPDFAFEERCLGQARLFSPLDTSGIVNHFWELRNPEGEVIESSLSANFSYLFNQAGTYELSYRQENELLCSGTSTKSIRINEAPIADFVLSEACVGEPIAVENITELNGNALNSFQWRLGDEVISTDSQLNYIFEESGEYTLSLEVETQGGCLESVSREIRVSPSPTAFFELPQSVGAFPFRLNLMAEGQVAIDNSQFTKNSITSPLGTEGFSRLWTLNGDTISTSSALDYTIEQAGTYLLGLIITNEAGCTAEHYEQVRVRPPSLDISLGNLRLNQDGEFTSFILNISNRGSLIPDRIDLDIDLGAYSVTESLESPLYPEENQNTSLSLKLSEEQLRGLSRICINATAYSADFEDSNPQNNRVCTNIESGFELLEMYPNPAMNQFTVPLIIPESDRLSISLEDSNGRQVRIFSYDLSSGYNEIPIQRESLSSGIYFLRFRFQGEEKIKKIIFQ